MNEGVGAIRTQRPVRVAIRVAAVVLMSATAAACVGGGASPSATWESPEQASAAATSSASAAATDPTASSSASASPLASVLATETPAQSPLPEPTFTYRPIPSVGTAPAGPWTGIRWTAGPLVRQPDPIGPTTGPTTQFEMSGWSRGYVGFRTTWSQQGNSGLHITSNVPSISEDGLRWVDGKALDLSGDGDMLGRIVEGPAGLLVVGYAGVACGPTSINAMWLSTDGLSWRRISFSVFGLSTPADGAVYAVEAGSSGYIATGSKVTNRTTGLSEPFLWTSRDGVAWTPVNLDKALFKGVVADNATAFAGGFVVAGAIPDPNGGCGDAGASTPSLWWSADGKNWIRDAVSGTTSGDFASMQVTRISDHLLLAKETTSFLTSDKVIDVVWTSADGRTWKLQKDALLVENQVQTNGKRGLLMSFAADPSGHLDIWDIRSDMSLFKLNQTGDLPTASFMNGAYAVFGPNGLVAATSDGSQFWVGVPTAG